jgi:hypothetical protein
LEAVVEHRHDLEEILLAGLPDDEREHVVEIIQNDESEARLSRQAAMIAPSEHAPDDVTNPAFAC